MLSKYFQTITGMYHWQLERGIGADFRFVGEKEGTDLDFIHRRTAEADIYFVRNNVGIIEH